MQDNDIRPLAERLVQIAADVVRLGIPDNTTVVIAPRCVSGIAATHDDDFRRRTAVDLIAELDEIADRTPERWTRTARRSVSSRGGMYELRAHVNGATWRITADLDDDATVDALADRIAAETTVEVVA